MTSGNIAVFDHDAQRIADLVVEFNRRFGIDVDRSAEVESEVNQALARKAPGEADTETVLRIKSLIRWSEAKAGAIVCGCREEHLHFLDLPFYRTGTIAKNPGARRMCGSFANCSNRVQPDQVFIAGDLPIRTARIAFAPKRSFAR